MTQPSRVRTGVAAVLGLCVAACSGAPQVRVVSTPPSANIYVNGELVGSTPQTIELPFGESPRVYVQVTHPTRQARLVILTEDTLPPDGEQAFDLPLGN